MEGSFIINEEQRTWAMMAHLSGYAGYLIPLGGIIVPIVIMYAKSESPVVSTIAKQAVLLNIAGFVGGLICLLLALTILLIPLAWLLGIVISVSVITLPAVGAIKAHDGFYFRYPIVGQYPY